MNHTCFRKGVWREIECDLLDGSRKGVSLVRELVRGLNELVRAKNGEDEAGPERKKGEEEGEA